MLTATVERTDGQPTALRATQVVDDNFIDAEVVGGDVVTIIERCDNVAKVQTAGGAVGWIKMAYLLVDRRQASKVPPTERNKSGSAAQKATRKAAPRPPHPAPPHLAMSHSLHAVTLPCSGVAGVLEGSERDATQEERAESAAPLSETEKNATSVGKGLFPADQAALQLEAKKKREEADALHMRAVAVVPACASSRPRTRATRTRS
jgi:hypothetical protein